MPISDYSTSAASNLLVGAIPIGPNAARDKMNDALQQILADIGAYKNGIIATKNVLDFGAVGNGTTDDTTAIQLALDSGADVYFPGTQAGRVYMFTNLTIPARTTLYGDGPRKSILRQVAGTLGVGLAYANTITSDITDGAPGFEFIGVEIATTCLEGVRLSAASINMGACRSFRLKSRHADTLTTLPYSVVAGQIGINAFDSAGGSSFKWTFDDQCEIRSFETAIKARATSGGINDWSVNAWIIDCKYSFDLQGVSAWKTAVDHESGVQNARCYLLDLAVSNMDIHDPRWELTQTGCYGIEFAATFTGANIRVFNPAVLIASDGGSIPGRKWTGTLPSDFIFHGSYQDLIDGAARPMIICPAETAVAMPSLMRVGGLDRGNGSINLGRDADNNAISRMYHDGTHCNVMGGNSLRLFGDGQTGANYKADINSTGIGFNGVNGVAKQTLGAAATDLATVITLANNIRTALINNGLGQN